MLDRHMAVHAEEAAAAKERERLALRAFRVRSNGDGDGVSAGVEELHCFLPAVFPLHLCLPVSPRLAQH
ncbi:hypothetical protein CesoFtcFv8_011730 [Champsocephalus esox]|uniref:Uncharacterized protein n=1 Tax=Champsocephalus esox TaxID=159716 RepID=A0AAN8C385_9TELE|nr:hypothetical protein CesoFtcFv8_011730 [Champsocephalus esox]